MQSFTLPPRARANGLHVVEIDFGPAELAVARTGLVEGEALGRLQQFRQQGGEFLKRALAAVAEQPVGEAEQARLGGHRIFQGALNGAGDLLGKRVLDGRGNRMAGSRRTCGVGGFRRGIEHESQQRGSGHAIGQGVMNAHDQGAAPVAQAVHDVDFPERLAAVQASG